MCIFPHFFTPRKKIHFSVKKATLESQMSICLSVTETPQPLIIAPISHQAYQPSSLSTIQPIDHPAYRPLPSPPVSPSLSHTGFCASKHSWQAGRHAGMAGSRHGNMQAGMAGCREAGTHAGNQASSPLVRGRG